MVNFCQRCLDNSVGKGEFFSANGIGTIGLIKDRSRPLLPSTKINSKYIIDQNIRAKGIQFLEENTGENLYDHRLGKDFLDKTLKVTKSRLVIS